MFDRLIRYLPVLDYIGKYRPQKILEVGSGAKGLGEFCSVEFTGVDLHHDSAEFPVHNMTFVQSTASKLPFSKGEFDLVVCMDVMEHVPEKERERVLQEMLRVAGLSAGEHCSERAVRVEGHRTVIIGYPCGRGAEKLSRKMYSWFHKRGSGTAKWMKEHVSFGLPNDTFKIQNSKFKIKEFNNENLLICEWILKLEEYPRFLKLEKFLFTHFRSLVKFFLRRVNFGKCYRKIWVITNSSAPEESGWQKLWAFF